jgi:hypothetical protein
MIVTALSPRVWKVTGFLNASECERLIALAEETGFAAADVRTGAGQMSMPNIRNNERTIFESPAWVDVLWQRFRQCNLPPVEDRLPIGLPKALRFYKYQPGQRFKMHKDGPWQQGGLSSKLTLLVYLNEQFSGGATDFREFQVVPATGTAVVFVHDTWHEGTAVAEGIKYVLRSDILFGNLLA